MQRVPDSAGAKRTWAYRTMRYPCICDLAVKTGVWLRKRRSLPSYGCLPSLSLLLKALQYNSQCLLSSEYCKLQDTDKSERKHRKHKDRGSSDSKDHAKRRSSKRETERSKAALNDLEEFLGSGDTMTSSTGAYESL